MNTNELLNQFYDFCLEYGPKVVGAILVLVIGLWVIKALLKGMAKMLDKRQMDPSLKSFLKSIAGILLKVMLTITVLTMLGIEMTSFVAILGAAGLAVGLALSGTLQNFAGGVMILIFKPLRVGDYIDAQGQAGTVKEIHIINTVLKTPDNVTKIIPNGALFNGSLTNYSMEGKRRVDWLVGIGYGDDYDKAKEVLMNFIKADDRIINDPAEPFIALSELGDSSVNLAVRCWVKASDYWAVKFDMNEKIYKNFPKEGLNIPFPQMDVHVHKE
jgi:small conductance mechanosensitive channel